MQQILNFFCQVPQNTALESKKLIKVPGSRSIWNDKKCAASLYIVTLDPTNSNKHMGGQWVWGESWKGRRKGLNNLKTGRGVVRRYRHAAIWTERIMSGQRELRTLRYASAAILSQEAQTVVTARQGNNRKNAAHFIVVGFTRDAEHHGWGGNTYA